MPALFTTSITSSSPSSRHPENTGFSPLGTVVYLLKFKISGLLLRAPLAPVCRRQLAAYARWPRAAARSCHQPAHLARQHFTFAAVPELCTQFSGVPVIADLAFFVDFAHIFPFRRCSFSAGLSFGLSFSSGSQQLAQTQACFAYQIVSLLILTPK